MEKLAVPLCPEVLGGRPVPRTPCEITGGTAADVLDGKAKVKDKDGRDVTVEILEGVKSFIKAARRMNVDAVILKTKSPTCGSGLVYDGTFSGNLIKGNGVLAEALEREGIKVYNEENCASLADALLGKGAAPADNAGEKEGKKVADASFLLTYPIYRDFEPGDIDVLSGICSEEKHRDKEVIFSAGAPGDAMYMIKSGTVKIWVETQQRKKMVALLSDGEFFGEMALIDNAPRSATVTAEGDTELIKLSIDGFNRLKTEFSSTGFKVVGVLLKFMAHRIRRTTKKAAELIKGRKKARKKK